MENKTRHEKERQTDWKGIVQGFVANILERVGENISQKVQAFFDRLKKKTIGTVLMLVGVVFLLAAAAILINTLLPGHAWAGWGIVGLVLIAVGYVVTKE